MPTRRHRVVVQLKDVDNDDEGESSVLTQKLVAGAGVSKASNKTPRNADVEIINPNTLIVSVVDRGNATGRRSESASGFNSNISSFGSTSCSRTSGTSNALYRRPSQLHIHKLHFDSVGNPGDPQTRAEFNALMDSVLIQRHDCCLLRLCAIREIQQSFLSNLLVTEVDRRMNMLQSRIQSIQIDYFDLRKYDLVNMLARPQSARSKHKWPLHPTQTFGSTMDVLRWLQSKYPQLYPNGCGHEVFDVQFIYTDTRRRTNTVRLSLIQIYLGQMDYESKISLRTFFEELDGERKLNKTLLTDYLKEYFMIEEKWRTWILFDVPIAYGTGTAINELIGLASIAYKGVISMKDNEEDQFSLVCKAAI